LKDFFVVGSTDGWLAQNVKPTHSFRKPISNSYVDIFRLQGGPIQDSTRPYRENRVQFREILPFDPFFDVIYITNFTLPYIDLAECIGCHKTAIVLPLLLKDRTNALIMGIRCLNQASFPVEDETVGLNLDQLGLGLVEEPTARGRWPGKNVESNATHLPGWLADVFNLSLQRGSNRILWVTIPDRCPEETECGYLPLLEGLELDTENGLDDGWSFKPHMA